jgi:hypothetical protein
MILLCQSCKKGRKEFVGTGWVRGTMKLTQKAIPSSSPMDPVGRRKDHPRTNKKGRKEFVGTGWVRGTMKLTQKAIPSSSPIDPVGRRKDHPRTNKKGKKEFVGTGWVCKGRFFSDRMRGRHRSPLMGLKDGSDKAFEHAWLLETTQTSRSNRASTPFSSQSKKTYPCKDGMGPRGHLTQSACNPVLLPENTRELTRRFQLCNSPHEVCRSLATC